MFEKNIADVLEEQLPFIIKRIAKNNRISEYAKNYDFLDERLKKWHQFGLFTHSKKVRKSLKEEVPILLTEWKIKEHVDTYFSNKIENIEKKILFEISIPIHDLGKIVVYGNNKKDREHEKYSKSLLYSDFLTQKLHSLNLSDSHIEYIGKCIEKHGVLGKEIRDILKNSEKLNLEYFSNIEIISMFNDLSKKYNELKYEIGIFYLCDSLGRIDIRIKAEEDSQILKQENEILNILKKRNLSNELINAVKQLSINIKLSEIYLKQLCHPS